MGWMTMHELTHGRFACKYLLDRLAFVYTHKNIYIYFLKRKYPLLSTIRRVYDTTLSRAVLVLETQKYDVRILKTSLPRCKD